MVIAKLNDHASKALPLSWTFSTRHIDFPRVQTLLVLATLNILTQTTALITPETNVGTTLLSRQNLLAHRFLRIESRAKQHRHHLLPEVVCLTEHKTGKMARS